MWRVVLDTSVIASAFRSPRGASRRLIDLVGYQVLVPLVTTALFLEYEDVLKRDEQRAVSGFSLAQIDEALAAFASAAEPVEIHYSWRPQLADADDEMVLDAAVNGQADALITHNLSDFAAAATKFGLQVQSPGAFLERIKV